MYSNVPLVHIAPPAFELTKEKEKEKKSTEVKAPQTKILAQTTGEKKSPQAANLRAYIYDANVMS